LKKYGNSYENHTFQTNVLKNMKQLSKPDAKHGMFLPRLPNLYKVYILENGKH